MAKKQVTYTPLEQEKLLKEYMASNMSVEAFAQKHMIEKSTMLQLLRPKDKIVSVDLTPPIPASKDESIEVPLLYFRLLKKKADRYDKIANLVKM